MSQPTQSPKRGRPPSLRARAAILETAYRILMEEGLGRLTIERVALEAGVGKPTIYRSWTNAQELAMAAFLARPEADAAAPATALSVRHSLKAHLAGVIAAFASHRGRQITLTLASADPESDIARAFRHQIILKSRDAGRVLLEEGMARGELRPVPDVEVVLDMLYGPLFFRLLARHAPLSVEFAARIVDAAMDGISVLSPGPPGTPLQGHVAHGQGPPPDPG